MKLIYRGVSYQTQPRAIATKKTNLVAKFRGLSYPLSQSLEPVNDSPSSLKYRGISYQKGTSNLSCSYPLSTTQHPSIALG